jgi:signal transduction histidine kinase
MPLPYRTAAFVLLSLPLAAADGAALLRDAIAYYDSQGAMALVKEAGSGKFHDSPAGYLLVFDEGGKTIIHGVSSQYIGVSMANLKDANGKSYIKDVLAAHGKGKGKTSFTQSKGDAQVKKTMLWEVHDGVFFAWVMDES